MIIDEEPDWDFWPALPSGVEPWQAVDLSFNVDPDTHFYRDRFNWDSDGAVDKRERLLKEYMSNTGFFSPEVSGTAVSGSNKVKLPEFAAWLVWMGFKNIPPELAALASKAPPPRNDVTPSFKEEPIREDEPQQQVQKETANWKLRVQTEAARRWAELRKAGANPTKFSIRDDLASWCQQAGVKTKSNINPTAEYIYRHALRAWKPPTA
ncbi:MAG: hypothetical protein IH606_12815 [Burkholderiales bacterium]|nr:hypothetical protein [Burkholderiales bacterium]